MIMSDHTAPTFGLANPVTVTVDRMNRRNALSAVSTVENGLRMIRMLIAFEARNTTTNAAISTGTEIAL